MEETETGRLKSSGLKAVRSVRMKEKNGRGMYQPGGTRTITLRRQGLLVHGSLLEI
jgi:hypothetical protein